jgi:hypothetical protein
VQLLAAAARLKNREQGSFCVLHGIEDAGRKRLCAFEVTAGNKLGKFDRLRCQQGLKRLGSFLLLLGFRPSLGGFSLLSLGLKPLLLGFFWVCGGNLLFTVRGKETAYMAVGDTKVVINPL